MLQTKFLLHFKISCTYIYIYIYIYIKKNRDREPGTGKHREGAETKRIERKCGKKVWFDFHVRYRGENTAKDSPPFRKN